MGYLGPNPFGIFRDIGHHVYFPQRRSLPRRYEQILGTQRQCFRIHRKYPCLPQRSIQRSRCLLLDRGPETGKNLIWQKTQAVLPGKYRFSAFAAGCVWGNKNQNLGYDGELYLFINGQKTALTSSTFNRYTVEIEISSEGTELTVGLQAGEKNTATWAIIAQTRLEYLGNEAILKETDTQYGMAKDLMPTSC